MSLSLCPLTLSQDDSPGQRTSHVLSTSQLQSLAHGLFPAEEEGAKPELVKRRMVLIVSVSCVENHEL